MEPTDWPGPWIRIPADASPRSGPQKQLSHDSSGPTVKQQNVLFLSCFFTCISVAPLGEDPQSRAEHLAQGMIIPL